MFNRRTFSAAVSSIGLTQFSGCGGGGGGATSSLKVPEPVDSSSAKYVIMVDPFTGDRVVSGQVDNANINVSTKIIAGARQARAIALNAANHSSVTEFDANKQVSVMNLADGSKFVFEYRGDITITRRIDPSNNFVEGFVSFPEANGQMMAGKLLGPTFVSTGALVNIKNVSDDVNTILSRMESSSVAQFRPLNRLLDLVLSRAYAQTSDEDPIADVKKDLIEELKKKKGLIAISVFITVGIVIWNASKIIAAVALLLAELPFLAIILIVLAVILLSKSASASTAARPATFKGFFSGGDSGTFQASIAPDLRLTGTGFSNTFSANFGVTGQASIGGSFTLSTSGSASTGATFSGITKDTQIKGAWTNQGAGVSGSFFGYLSP